jgi:hypothetical protein
MTVERKTVWIGQRSVHQQALYTVGFMVQPCLLLCPVWHRWRELLRHTIISGSNAPAS